MRSLPLLCSMFTVLSLACGTSSKESESKEQGAAKVAEKRPPVPVSKRLSLRTWRPLLKETLRAELDVDGMTIDFGSSDQHKFTRGGWASGWLDMGVDTDGTTFAQTKGDATVYLTLRQEVPRISIRARSSSKDGTLQLALGKTKLGEAQKLTSTWSTLTVALPPDSLDQGRAQLTLQTTAATEIDWIWFPRSENGDTPSLAPRTLPIKFEGGSRRSLAAPSSRSFSYYLHVPPSAKLIVDTGSDQSTTFSIFADTTTSGTQELLKDLPPAGAWKEQVVDLSSLSGQAVRLTFVTEGAKGKTGWGEPEIMIPKGAPPKTGKKAKNLVYVVMDTTRADAFSTVHPDTDVETPFYDALAAKATTFVNAYNNENWTKPSVTTMWSGLYPQTHGARQATSKVDESIRFLPQKLQEAGFTTGAFIANAVVSKTFGFDKGWTHFQNDSDHNLNGNGSKLYPNASTWLTEHKDERFFLYVQSVDPHTTYDVPAEYSAKYYKGKYSGSLGSSFDREEQIVVDNGKKKINANDLAWIWALYKGEVTYQDQYLGGLLATIEKLGLSEDTLVVITNDHGEEIRDHGAMGHGWPLFEEQIRAPLLMKFDPLFRPGAKIKAVTEHVDLAPTILDALGVSPMVNAEGLSFLPYIEDGVGKRQHPFYSVAWSRKGLRSIRVGDYKLIVGKSSGWTHLFNLATDPAEKKNLLSKKKPPSEEALLVGRLCEIYLSETLATPDKTKRLQGAGQKRDYSSPEIPIDEKTRKELEALGYL